MKYIFIKLFIFLFIFSPLLLELNANNCNNIESERIAECDDSEPSDESALFSPLARIYESTSFYEFIGDTPLQNIAASTPLYIQYRCLKVP